MSLSDDIKSLAHECGFHAVGITGVEPFDASYETLLDRYDKGLLEGSGYNSEVARQYTHPAETMPSARSIISVALSYLTDDMDELTSCSGPRGWMARFSRGLDYHPVIQDRLLLLSEAVQAKLGRRVQIRSMADTGPIADRSVAIRAGIGSRGKNTCVYVGEYKSWVILGELVTDIDLQPDEPAPLNVCGECGECMAACPTGAICAPYTVDVKICLSYITQSKGFIPHRLRKKMGTRIYGCDTCQSACPLNRGAKPGNIDSFRSFAGLGRNPELLPLLNIAPDEFKMKVAPTTAGWIRRTRIRRNVAVALGNIGDPAAIPELICALFDEAPVIRGHAAWALGQIGTSLARMALDKALTIETDVEVIREIHDALDISSL
ncbi:MAG: tRNA epoxyqueuosine(34) reductase QueG [Armatimonadota bacterium]